MVIQSCRKADIGSYVRAVRSRSLVAAMFSLGCFFGRVSIANAEHLLTLHCTGIRSFHWDDVPQPWAEKADYFYTLSVKVGSRTGGDADGNLDFGRWFDWSENTWRSIRGYDEQEYTLESEPPGSFETINRITGAWFARFKTGIGENKFRENSITGTCVPTKLRIPPTAKF
jgi:hypothetical protein